MPDIKPETAHFGMTRINQGEAFSKNGWAFTDEDRIKLDDILYALMKHVHTGEPKLGNPTDPPTFNAVSTGGHLAAATTYYYRASFIDQWGLETAASPEGNVTTPNPISPPSSPNATVETTAGAVTPGVYSYLATFTDNYGGETTPSSVNNVQVLTGTTNRIRLEFGSMPSGALQIKIYRSRPGQSLFYYVGASDGSAFYDGGLAEDATVTVPTRNTTNSANSVEVTIPLDFIPLGCVGWRIYRATASGAYTGTSLVHEVVEGFTDTSIVPRTMWVDTGDALLQGFPQNLSATIEAGSFLTLNELEGTLPLATVPRGARVLGFYKAGVVSDGDTISISNSPTDIKPVRFTAFFVTPPDGGTTVTIRISGNDATPAHVDLVCEASPATPAGPDGYYEAIWPLAEALLVYAQNGTVSSGTDCPTITDQLSDSGQSVLLQVHNSWTETSMSTLDLGDYEAIVSIRTNTNTDTANDIRVDVIRLDTNTVIATANYDLLGAPTLIGFNDLDPLAFTAPGDCEIAIRVTKATAATQVYEVESMRYVTTVPLIAAGLLTCEAMVDGGTTAAADVNIALWF